MGRCLEATPLRLGVQGAASRPGRGVRAVAAVRAGAGEPTAADRLRHDAVPDPHELDEHRQPDTRVQARGSRRGEDAGPAQMGVLESRSPSARRDPAVAHRARGCIVRIGGSGAARARPRPAGGGPFREPARVLHVRRRRRPAARRDVHPDAGAGTTHAGTVRPTSPASSSK